MYLIHGTLLAALLLRDSGVSCGRAMAGEALSAEFRRQGPTKSAAEKAADQSNWDFMNKFTPAAFGGGVGVGGGGAMGAQAADKYTTPSTTTKKMVRTTPERVSQKEDCDYLAYYCLRAYRTGKLCGRTIYYKYQSFSNYCLLDYVNCKEGYEVWQIVHMGECFDVEPVKQYKHYVYDDDSFLDQIYVIDDW